MTAEESKILARLEQSVNDIKEQTACLAAVCTTQARHDEQIQAVKKDVEKLETRGWMVVFAVVSGFIVSLWALIKAAASAGVGK